MTIEFQNKRYEYKTREIAETVDGPAADWEMEQSGWKRVWADIVHGGCTGTRGRATQRQARTFLSRGPKRTKAHLASGLGERDADDKAAELNHADLSSPRPRCPQAHVRLPAAVPMAHRHHRCDEGTRHHHHSCHERRHLRARPPRRDWQGRREESRNERNEKEEEVMFVWTLDDVIFVALAAFVLAGCSIIGIIILYDRLSSRQDRRVKR